MNIKELDSRKPGFSYFSYLKLFSPIEITILISIVLMAFCNIYIACSNPINFPDAGDSNAFYTLETIPLIITLLVCFKLMYNKKNNRVWLVYSALTLSIGIFVTCICGMGSVSLTPHTRIDAALAHFDQILGFNLPAIMAFTHKSYALTKVSLYSYNTWIFQIELIPLLIAVIGDYKRVLRYYLSFIIAVGVGGTIYYFWPTTAPATVLHSKYFTVSQHHLVQNFLLMRAGNTHLLPTQGLISFPSFHVLGATLITMLVWKNKILRWPILILNIFLIYATLGLGFHYLVDVIAGMIIAVASFYLAGHVAEIKSLKHKQISRCRLNYNESQAKINSANSYESA